MTSAAVVVALANARADRRPARAPRAFFHDGLGDAESASRLLEPFLGRPVDPADLRALHALHRAVVVIVDALIVGSPPPLDALNDLAARAPVTYGLARGSNGELRAVMSPEPSSAVGKLVLEVVRELGELEPSRLRRCERPECRLVFYDTTRSATQRWHAESPCGVRERQRRYRTNHHP